MTADRVGRLGALLNQALAYSKHDARGCASSDRIGTTRIPGRPAASQIASASARSFLLRLTNGLTY